MFTNLKNHPFAVEAFFEHSIVLTFAVPRAELASLIPPCLRLDTYADEWAFLAVAAVQTKHLRPKGWPSILGQDFLLLGYRVFVRYTTAIGKNWRGLYILKSQTDKEQMAFFGNLFTHYNYTTTDAYMKKEDDHIEIHAPATAFQVNVQTGQEEVALPPGSPFPDWKTARRYAGPLPFTFTYNAAQRQVLIIEGVRQHWKPQPIWVEHYEVPFIKELKLKKVCLANAFMVSDIPYYWKKGQIERWNG